MHSVTGLHFRFKIILKNRFNFRARLINLKNRLALLSIQIKSIVQGRLNRRHLCFLGEMFPGKRSWQIKGIQIAMAVNSTVRVPFFSIQFGKLQYYEGEKKSGKSVYKCDVRHVYVLCVCQPCR